MNDFNDPGFRESYIRNAERETVRRSVKAGYEGNIFAAASFKEVAYKLYSAGAISKQAMFRDLTL